MRFVAAVFGMLFAASSAIAAPYIPPKDPAWAHRSPAAVGMDAAKLERAIALAKAHESRMNRDPRVTQAALAAREGSGALMGPFRERAPVNGLVLRHGYIVAEFGDTSKTDMTFSVTKSFLSTVIGLAVDDGKIPNVDDRVSKLVHDGGYDSPHNAPITWRQSLQQANEWEGTLFGKSDVADRRRGKDRQLQAPGGFFEYNDVRVNRTSLSALRVWKQPLPDVLRQRIMTPIGATNDWRWVGYDNADVEVDGRTIRSVPGGGHWGAGLWISARDMARVCLLFSRDGKWGNRQLISQKWVREAMTPSEQNPEYGYMWWLNIKNLWPGLSPKAYGMRGSGGNGCYVDPEKDLVVVMRWLDDKTLPDVLGGIARSIN